MNKKIKTIINNMKNKQYKVTEVNKNSFTLENGVNILYFSKSYKSLPSIYFNRIFTSKKKLLEEITLKD